MSVISRLVAFLAESLGPDRQGRDGDEDPGPQREAEDRLAAAALLVHVARVDGSLDETENARLARLFRAGFDLSDEEAERLVARATAYDDETSNVASLVEIVARDADAAERRHLLAMAYSVAAADGSVHEFEDDLVWRVGRLLGFDDDEIVAQRDGAVPASASPGEPA
jgi:uncharacterized tellurite resistance protein B-like protein